MRARLVNLFVSVVLIGGAGALALDRPAWAGGNPNGIGGSTPAYYDHQLFTINLKQLSTAQATLLKQNSQQNTIYESDPGLPGGQPFIAVIDAIQTDGFNPLWAEVQITFNGGTPHQLFSDDEILAAAASGEITLTPTHEMYRCSVIGAPNPPANGVTTSLGSNRSIVGSVGGSSAVQVQTTRSTSWGALKHAYR